MTFDSLKFKLCLLILFVMLCLISNCRKTISGGFFEEDVALIETANLDGLYIGEAKRVYILQGIYPDHIDTLIWIILFYNSIIGMP